MLSVNIDWPTEITETEFFRRVKEMPKGKVYGFLSKSDDGQQPMTLFAFLERE